MEDTLHGSVEADVPFVELRIYTIRPGFIEAYLDYYERAGKEVHWRHLGRPLLYCTTDCGDQQQVIHIWQYDSFTDRKVKRRALAEDPAWGEYRRQAAFRVVEQEVKILRPVPWSLSEGSVIGFCLSSTRLSAGAEL